MCKYYINHKCEKGHDKEYMKQNCGKYCPDYEAKKEVSEWIRGMLRK